MAIASGRRDRARRWSRAVHTAYPHVQGLFYCSSMNANEPCVALYERAIRVMPSNPEFHRLLSDPIVLTMLENACARSRTR
jgi:hypothetical protein